LQIFFLRVWIKHSKHMINHLFCELKGCLNQLKSKNLRNAIEKEFEIRINQVPLVFE
jgi:hypothetical protein